MPCIAADQQRVARRREHLVRVAGMHVECTDALTRGPPLLDLRPGASAIGATPRAALNMVGQEQTARRRMRGDNDVAAWGRR